MAKQQPAFALAVEDSSGSLLSDVVVEASTIQDLRGAGIRFNDLQTSQSSLEEIFVDLVHKGR